MERKQQTAAAGAAIFEGLEMITIFIPGDPDTVTAQQKGLKIMRSRTGKYYPQFYEKPEVRAANSKLAYKLMDFKPADPITGPIELMIVWAFANGKRPKKNINTFRETRPDLDNLNKNIMDILTRLKFWNDDSQVAKLLLMKRWVADENAGIHITINQIEGGEGITC